MNNLLIATSLAAFALVVQGLTVYLARRMILQVFGVYGLLLLCFTMAIVNVQAIGWTASLNYPFNDPADPHIDGVGGDPYGLDYSIYPEVVWLTNIVSVSLLLATLSWSALYKYDQKCPSPSPQRLVKIIPKNRRALCLGFLFVLLITIAQFSAAGWEYIFQGNESSAAFRRGGSGGATRGDAAVLFRILPILNFLVVLVGAFLPIMAARMRLHWIGLLGAGIASLFPIVSSSRSLGIIAIGVGVSLFIRVSGRFRWAGAAAAFVISMLGFSLPLEMRSNLNTGVVANLIGYFEEHDSSSEWLDRLRSLIMNISLGFPIMAEAVGRAPHDPQLERLPGGYRAKMISPLPGKVDGFAADLAIYKPRINAYTPYSGLAEVHGLYGQWGLAALGFVSFLSLLALRRFTIATRLVFVSAAVCGLMMMGVLQVTTYDLRTATRFYYLALATLFLFSSLFMFGLIPRRISNRPVHYASRRRQVNSHSKSRRK